LENYDSYGKEAEKAVLQYILENSGFHTVRTQSCEDDRIKTIQDNVLFTTPLFRLKAGDILIYFEEKQGPIKINVVRGTWISDKAISSFHGNFYCLFPDGDISDPSQARIIMKKTIDTFYRACKKNGKISEMIGVKSGYRYNKVQKFITLQDFIVFLIKLKILGYTGESMEYYKTIKQPWWGKKEKRL